MSLKPMIAATAIAIGISGMAGVVATPAHAQDAVEAEMVGYHQLCQKGDRKACVRFGILIGRNEQRHADWRHAPADWWWFEHGRGQGCPIRRPLLFRDRRSTMERRMAQVDVLIVGAGP